MSEINGNPVVVGDTILVQTQVAKVTQYDEQFDRMTYVIGEGNGTNFVQAHISNTKFELIDLSNHTTLAQQQSENLDDAVAEVKRISDPQEEDPETDRVKGEIGAKLPGRPDETTSEPEAAGQSE